MRGYASRRLSESMRCPRPVETPDTDAATIYDQRWRRRDGTMVRAFYVLALDEQMAETMGGIRLVERFNQNVMDWTLVLNRPCERITSVVYAILQAEDPDETKLREETFMERSAA